MNDFFNSIMQFISSPYAGGTLIGLTGGIVFTTPDLRTEENKSLLFMTRILFMLGCICFYFYFTNEDKHKQMPIYSLVQIIKPALKDSEWPKNSKIKYEGTRTFASTVTKNKHRTVFRIKETKICSWSTYPAAEFTPAQTLQDLIPAFDIFQKLYPLESFLLYDFSLKLPEALNEFCTKIYSEGFDPKLTKFPNVQAILETHFGNYRLLMNIQNKNGINQYSFGLTRYSISPLLTRGRETLIF